MALPYELLIGLRYTRAKRRNHFISFISLISMLGIGLGVAALAPRMVPFGAVDVGPRLGLPDLPRLPILLHTRVRDSRARDALAALSAAFRGVVRS